MTRGQPVLAALLVPLEWRPDTLFGGEGGFVGQTKYRHVQYDYGGPRYGIANYSTMEEAKAAAEADHRAFILNAFGISP